MPMLLYRVIEAIIDDQLWIVFVWHDRWTSVVRDGMSRGRRKTYRANKLYL